MKKKRKIRLRRIAERAAARRKEREGETLTGVISITAAGYGFLTPDNAPEGTEEIFIPAKFAGFALDGDHVKIKILPPRPGHPEDSERGPVGKVLDVLKRERESFVARLLPGSFVSPLNPKLPEVVSIHGSRKGAQRGDWVKIRCETGKDGELTGTIGEFIGKGDELSAELDAVMAEFDLPGKYSEAEEAAAKEIIPAEIPRKDRRELFVLTIDPFDAKDFDDALSVTDNGDGTWCVGIHIADVAAYIHPRDRFDKAAEKRGFSCYLPGRTLPMLPAGLTAKISMQENQDSLAHTVFLKVDSEGKIISGEREHSLIRVAKRLDYDEVQKFLDSGEAGASWSAETVKTVKMLSEVVRKMRKQREITEEFIELPLPEVRVICDEKNNTVSGIERKVSRESEQLVEECMLAANQFVGLYMPQKQLAGIYRIHPEPEPEKTIEFSETMKSAFDLSVGDIADRKCCREFIASLPDDPVKNLILNMILRSMTRASYSVKGDIHFALGKTFYAHFTSPIRRYTDLTVHQQLWNFDLNNRTRSGDTLAKVAEYCSELEEKIDSAYFTANDRLKVRMVEELSEREPGRKFDCMVTKVLNSGFQVEVQEFAVYAFVHRDELQRMAALVDIGMVLQLKASALRFQFAR
ncbi:MAG: VacB/RNase II family 3'-5' exoribonuclease [Lentisphaeria bacterium]|nr:VacB/RNase II family 3'-5' exoribonuclease [Lentisphaeria bacterium]